ncbi:MAG: YCF48-related protein [bacterium]
MRRMINTLTLVLALCLSLKAQERQISQKPLVVEVTDDDINSLNAMNANVIGAWSDPAEVKIPNQKYLQQSGDGWISLSPPVIGEALNDVHTFSANTAVIIGNRGAIYKTTDQGNNWIKIESGTTRDLNGMFFLDASRGWIVGDSGTILKTTNGGESWQFIDTNLYSLKDVYFTDATTGYAISSSRIYKTTDAGENWVEKFKAPEVTYFFESIAFSDANTGIAVGSLSKMYRTTDAGENWELVETGSTVWKYDVQFIDAMNGWMAGLQATRIRIEVGWLGTNIDIDNPRYTLWKTADGGATWTQLNFAYSGRFYGVYFHDATNGWAVGTNGAVFHTEDGGSNWSATRSVHNMYAVHFSDAHAGWAVGLDGTILQTNNAGNLWILQSGNGTTSNLNTVHFNDSQTGWAAGYRGKMLHTTNGGELWFEQSFGTYSDLESIFFVNDQKGYAVFGWYPYIRYTIDGGINWKNLSGPPPSFQGLNCVYFVDDQNGWIVGKNGKIMHTTNAGTSWGNWSSQTSGTNTELNSVYFVNPLTGWAVGEKGTIIHTVDGGITWTPQEAEITDWENLKSVYFIDSMHGFAVGASSGMLQTVDGGANWKPNKIVDNRLYSVYFADEQTGWAAGYKGTILKTTDAGNTWGLQKSGTTESLQSVHFVDTQNGYVVGEKGTIIKTTTGGGLTLYPPILSSPLEGATELSTGPTLSWNAASGATSYRLQVSTSPTFSQTVVDQSGITGTSYQIAELENSTQYYWRVSAMYFEGESNWSNVWSFTTIIVPPPAPLLSSPSNDADNQLTTLRLRWQYVPGAIRYHLQVATDALFTTTVYDDSSVTSSSKKVDSLDINTAYYWRVRALNAFVYGSWSNVWSFTTISAAPTAPMLSRPSNGAANQKTTVYLSWHSTTGTESYRLQLAVDSLFTSVVFDDSSMTYSSKRVEALTANTTYFWRVRAKNIIGASPWSSVWTFSTISGAPPAPSLSWPIDGAVNQPTSLYLNWEDSEGAESYRLQLAVDSLFTTLVFDDSSMSYSSKRVEALAANTTYYWRVRAKNIIGASPWSSVWRFSTISGAPPAPSLSWPIDGAVNQPTSLYLNWEDSEGAESYRLQLDTDSLFTTVVFDDSSMRYSNKRVEALAANTTYYWRVRAKNVIGAGPWSVVWRFTTISTAPSAPLLYWPNNGAENQPTNLDLDWGSAEGAETYHLQVATDFAFTAMVFEDSDLSWTGEYVESLAINTTYFWRVRAKNALGASPWSEVWSFTTVSAVPSTPYLDWPDNGAMNQPTNLELEWDGSVGAETYHLQVATDSAFTAMVFDDFSIEYTSEEIGPLAINTTYYWRVKAKNVLGDSPWSAVWRFTTISAAPSTPHLDWPYNGSENQPTTLYLEWDDAEGAESYHLQVATDSVFTAIVFNDSSLTWNNRRVGPLAINTTYYWRVKAKNVLGASPWSDVWSFTTISTVPSAPDLDWPSNGAVSQPINPLLRWEHAEGAENYSLQVATDSVFTAIVFDDSSLTWRNRRVGPLAISTTYYWRVKAKNVLGDSPWSIVWSFTTISAAPIAPKLTSPTNGAVSQSIKPFLRWEQAEGAENYSLQVATDSVFTAIVFDDSSLTWINRRVGPLAINTTYYWRVRAKNILGISQWSNIWRFTTIAGKPNQVSLISPVNFTVIKSDSVRFTWRQGTPAVYKYWFEIAADSLMANAMVDSTLMATDTTKIVRQLNDKHDYWWRVKAKNAAGWGEFSEKRQFRIDITTTVQTNMEVPHKFGLSQNYPNPFNPQTTIKYQLPKAAEVKLTIYNLLGQRVAMLVDKKMPAGFYSIQWDGKDQNGRNVASGIYVYRLQTADFVKAKKLTLLR